MRNPLSAVLFCCLSLAAFAAEIKIKVTDPQGAAVANARVALVATDDAVLAVTVTRADGIATFIGTGSGVAIVQVFAPGFAPAARSVTSETMAIQLEVAVQPETVNVTAAQTPVSASDVASPTEVLDERALTAMQPAYAADSIRFLPGAVVNNSGRRGGLASLFVRGGESRYNKVIIDGAPINEPGGTFDFGVVPMYQVSRIEFVRGAESVLYGSDAMTGVLQFFTPTGTTRIPEIRFGSEGGTFNTTRGYASVAGAYGIADYNIFGEQFNTKGQGVNDEYSNSAQGASFGIALHPRANFRGSIRHSNNRTGVQGFYVFGGRQLLPPDTTEYARQNNLLASASLSISLPSQWQHKLTGYEYRHKRLNRDIAADPGRTSPLFGSIDFPYQDLADQNRAGFQYQGEYHPRTWSRTVFGYEYEKENGRFGDPASVVGLTLGFRGNHALYGQQLFAFSRGTALIGARYVDNESFGSRTIPRVALTFVALRGNEVFSGTRLRGAYAEGIKEPRFEESFGIGSAFIVPNPDLRAEGVRSLEAGIVQGFFGDTYAVTAQYFNNIFRDRIDFDFDPVTFISRYLNLNKAIAHGAEFEFHARPSPRWTFDASYTHTSTQILAAPNAFDPLLSKGRPLLRRPKHSGTLLLQYFGNRWGGNLGGTLIGRRADSDFVGLLPPVTHVAGYARVDVGGWYALSGWATAYANIENLLDKKYEETAGYPGLRANFRAGMRFRFGGD